MRVTSATSTSAARGVCLRKHHRGAVADDAQPAFEGLHFPLLEHVRAVELGLAPAMAVDGKGKELEGKPATEQAARIERDREAVAMLFDEVVGEEGDQREEEEQAQVGPEDQGVDQLEAFDEIVVVDPVDAGEGERDQVDGERRQDGQEAGGAIGVRHLEVEHHDGDDDRDDAVGESFKAGWGGLGVHGGGRRLQRCSRGADRITE